MSKEKKEKPKPPTVNELKAAAFDVTQQIQQLQARYNAILEEIVKMQEK